MLSRTPRASSVVRIDSVICRSSRWPRSCCSSASVCSRSRSVVSALAIAWRREAGVDDEQPQVVVGELVEPELREDEDAEHLVVEHHRRQEHRFVEVVLGPGDGVRPRVGRGVAEVLGDPVGRDPAGDALAHRDAQLVGRLVDVLADLALHRDRDEVVADEPVDAGVVVVDELAQLGRDRLADLGDARQPAQPRARAAGSTGAGRPTSPSARSPGRPGSRRSPGSPAPRSVSSSSGVQWCGRSW